MTKSREMKRLRESMKGSESITDEDRKFMGRMAERMPKLSLRNNAERTGKEGQTRLDGGYLRKFRRE